MNVLGAQAAQALAQLQLVEERLSRVELQAPFDGLVVSGDLRQLVGTPLHRAVDDPVDIQFLGGTHRILCRAGVATHRTDRAHHQPWHDREARNQAVGHADLQQLIAALVCQQLERQNRQ